jgi:hypothetical protein
MPALHFRCPAVNATAAPMSLSCQCHALSLSCPCHVNATSGSVEPRSCQAMQLRFSRSFSVFPAVLAAFQAFLSLSLLMHALSQEQPRPLIFRSFLRPSTGSSHATQDLHAWLHTQGAHCCCQCHVMSCHVMSRQCHAMSCHASVMSCQRHVSPCQTPVLPCHATLLLRKLLHVSCRFRGLPDRSLSFYAYTCMCPHDPL